MGVALMFGIATVTCTCHTLESRVASNRSVHYKEYLPTYTGTLGTLAYTGMWHIHWNQEFIYYNALLTSTGIHWLSDIHGLIIGHATYIGIPGMFGWHWHTLACDKKWNQPSADIHYLTLHRPGEIEGQRDQSLNPPTHLERRGAEPSFLYVYSALHYKGNFKISDDTVGRVLSVSQNFSREYAARPL